jgi:hypothetical protein
MFTDKVVFPTPPLVWTTASFIVAPGVKSYLGAINVAAASPFDDSFLRGKTKPGSLSGAGRFGNIVA